MEKQAIHIPEITLDWSDWHPWESIKINAGQPDGVFIPDIAGVYEVKYQDSEIRLTIGKTVDLRRRVRRSLVQGKLPHSSGKRIRDSEDTSRLVVRWATTEYPAAVEEALHQQYIKKHGVLPKYTISTR
jgi:hypothetical protein